jgi:hypothetical protein
MVLLKHSKHNSQYRNSETERVASTIILQGHNIFRTYFVRPVLIKILRIYDISKPDLGMLRNSDIVNQNNLDLFQLFTSKFVPQLARIKIHADLRN